MKNKRTIKFRFWDNVDYMSDGYTLMDIQLKRVEFTSEVKIMQFTGMKDKDGKEIYEGDILEAKFFPKWVERISWKGKPDAICEVFWDLNSFRLKAKGEKDFRYPDFCDINLKHTKITGNIYQTSKKPKP